MKSPTHSTPYLNRTSNIIACSVCGVPPGINCRDSRTGLSLKRNHVPRTNAVLTDARRQRISQQTLVKRWMQEHGVSSQPQLSLSR